MKTLLALLITATAGGYYAVNVLTRAYEARGAIVTHPVTGERTDTFALGLEAITGRLSERQLAELEAALTHSEPAKAPGVSSPVPEVSLAPRAIAEAVRPNVVEAWADDVGLLHCRLADGSEWLRLESGTLVAVQPSTSAGLASPSPVQ